MTTRLLERRGGASEVDDGVDPRIAARRRSVRSDRNRRRVRILAAVAAVLAVLGLLWLLSRTALLDVDRIRVSGTSRLTADEVIDASGVRVGEPLLSVNTGAVEGRLEQQPWIGSARVRRGWSGDVSIEVVERSAVGRVASDDGAVQLIDRSGALLGPATDADAGLPEIRGVSPDALELAAQLPPGVRSRVSTVVGDDDGRLQLLLRPQGTVEFGPPTALPEKVAALVTVMGQVDQRDLCSIRVVTPDTPVVTRTPICG
jgi:cell division protein FtsQ